MATSPRVTDTTESSVTLTVVEWEKIYRLITNIDTETQGLAQKVWTQGIVAPQDRMRDLRAKSTSHTNRGVRLADLEQGTIVEIKFDDERYEFVTFISLDETGQHATFQTRNEDNELLTWEAERRNNFWCTRFLNAPFSVALPA